jgi:hypothetical protein|tara:strand:+ start:1620 stop:2222 length:603 start_codon:yes stop_codon:yes gene_type:complete
MNRVKKLRFIQFILLIAGLSIIIFTFVNKERSVGEKIISEANQKKINNQLKKQSDSGDVFYNIEYSGLDLEGNRYTIKSEEAINIQSDQKIVAMKAVTANFYFKDNTVLKVVSDSALYNNKSLDMVFTKNVNAFYEGSELSAQRAEFLNSKSSLTVSKEVVIKDTKGTMFADKLIFDIKKKTLNIASYNNNKIKANVDIK